MRPLVACCHLGLGELYRRSSNFRLAKEHLNSSVTLMRERKWVVAGKGGSGVEGSGLMRYRSRGNPDTYLDNYEK